MRGDQVLSCAIATSTLTTVMSPAIDKLDEDWLRLIFRDDDCLLFMLIAFSANVIESSFNILVAVSICDEVNDDVFIIIYHHRSPSALFSPT